VLAIDLPHARRLAFGVVLAQAAVTVTAALCALGLADRRAGFSALLGGGIATLGSLVMAGIVFGRRTAGSPQRALLMFFMGEAVKVASVIAMFVVVLKTVNVVPLAMLGAFAVTFVVYWIALIATVSSARGAQRGV
jgi:F0F1-type ATP synthase assembly protein I